VVYHAHTSRHAWNWSRSKRYYPDSSFSQDMQTAQHQSWAIRRQGTVRYISELPVLILQGRSVEVIVGQINAVRPLQEFTSIPDAPLSLGPLFKAFPAPRPNSVVRFVAPLRSTHLLTARLKQWRGIPRGEWREDGEPLERDPEAVRGIAAEIRSRLG
jgi:hypothetical protein